MCGHVHGGFFEAVLGVNRLRVWWLVARGCHELFSQTNVMLNVELSLMYSIMDQNWNEQLVLGESQARVSEPGDGSSPRPVKAEPACIPGG